MKSNTIIQITEQMIRDRMNLPIAVGDRMNLPGDARDRMNLPRDVRDRINLPRAIGKWITFSLDCNSIKTIFLFNILLLY